MGMRRAEKDVLDARGVFDFSPNGLGRLTGRRPAQIETHQGDFFISHAKHERPRQEGIEHSDAWQIVPGAVAPHGITDRRRNVDRFSLDDRHDLLHLEAQSLDHILNDRRSDPDCGQRVLSFASVPALGIVSQGQLRSGWQALGVTRDEACAACAAKRGAVETYPFGADTAVYKVGGKMFALIPRSAEPPRVSLKCDPAWAEVLRNA